MEKLHWAPKIKRAKIWQLYQSDARGAIDQDLLIDVSFSLKLRCQSILFVSKRQIECPRCRNVFPLPAGQWNGTVECPAEDCGWRIPYEEYHNSWRHQDLLAAGVALAAVEEFLRDYNQARTPAQQMFCTDSLLHIFHWDAAQDLPNRSFANNLIEGSHRQVIEFLDRLSFGDDPAAKERWRETVAVMMRRRGAKPFISLPEK